MKQPSPSGILITGASSGIGAALAETYATAGVTLFLCGRNADRLAQVADLCRKQGATVQPRILDVTDAASMRHWIATSDTEHALDLVIANAGISWGTDQNRTVNNDDIERDIFATNVKGVHNTVDPVIPLMQARRRGQIAIVSSLAGLREMPSAPAYSASKVAVRVYGESLRPQLAADGINVSVILPGFVESGITAQNDFPMPMIMPAKRAAGIIRRGLKWNQRRIAFPFPMYVMMWVLAALPPVIANLLLTRLPRKE